MDSRPQVRQGDVLLVPVSSLPATAKALPLENGRVILAHGEVTGHAHCVDSSVSKLFEASDIPNRFLSVDAPTMITHEEHSAKPVAPGIYEVRIQQEFDDLDQVRKVLD